MTEKSFFRFYPEDHYWLYFNQSNGTFVRAEEEGFPEPEHNSLGPELLDISITDRCNKGCVFCYKNSTPHGIEMSFEDYEKIVMQASKLGVLQVALGGGNPNEHSRFIDILRVTREKYNIVPNYSTNGQGLTAESPPKLRTVRKAATTADGGQSWYREESRTPASLRLKR